MAQISRKPPHVYGLEDLILLRWSRLLKKKNPKPLSTDSVYSLSESNGIFLQKKIPSYTPETNDIVSHLYSNKIYILS